MNRPKFNPRADTLPPPHTHSNIPLSSLSTEKMFTELYWARIDLLTMRKIVDEKEKRIKQLETELEGRKVHYTTWEDGENG